MVNNNMIGWQSLGTSNQQSNQLRTTAWIIRKASKWIYKKMEAQALARMLTTRLTRTHQQMYLKVISKVIMQTVKRHQINPLENWHQGSLMSHTAVQLLGAPHNPMLGLHPTQEIRWPELSQAIHKDVSSSRTMVVGRSLRAREAVPQQLALATE